MPEKLKKTTSVLLKLGRVSLRELMESFLYIAYICTPPFFPKLFQSYPDAEIGDAAIRNYISRLYKKGYISKIRKGRNIFIRLTADFWKIEKSSITVKKEHYKKRWDGKWRILIYDIPESIKHRRESLRQFIRELGFGMVQESCWVSSYDYSDVLYDFLQKKKILDYVCMYEGKFYAGKSIDILVEEVWKLKSLSERYEVLINSCKETSDAIMKNPLTTQKYYQMYYQLYDEYIRLLKLDPFLPDKFLKAQLFVKAEGVFNSVARLIAKRLQAPM